MTVVNVNPPITTTVSKVNNTLEFIWKAAIIIILLFALATFSWLSILNHRCEAFWGEQCTIVAAPASIKPMFGKKYYDAYNEIIPAATAEAPATPSTVK
jgi:hypothetical protein